MMLNIYCLIFSYFHNWFILGSAIMLGITYMHDSSTPNFTRFGNYVNRLSDTFIGWKTNKNIDKQTKTLYTCHPHGIIPCSTIHFLAKGIPVVVATIMLKSVLGPFPLKFHGFIDNKRETIIKNVENYGSVALYPGGSDELCLVTGNSKKFNIYLRTGFIRLAIEKEYSIIPVLVPAEEEAYTPFLTGCWRFKHKMWKSFGISLGMHHGRYWLMTVPRKMEDPCIYYGEPIKCNITDTVDTIKDRYVEELNRLAVEAGVEINVVYA